MNVTNIHNRGWNSNRLKVTMDDGLSMIQQKPALLNTEVFPPARRLP